MTSWIGYILDEIWFGVISTLVFEDWLCSYGDSCFLIIFGVSFFIGASTFNIGVLILSTFSTGLINETSIDKGFL